MNPIVKGFFQMEPFLKLGVLSMQRTLEELCFESTVYAFTHTMYCFMQKTLLTPPPQISLILFETL